MPRINRRSRAVRQRGLNDTQRQLLIQGDVLVPHGDEPGFASDAEERAAWRESRAELMAVDLGPGRRPHAYLKYDLRVSDPPIEWSGMMRILLENGLLSAEEQIRCEKAYPMLAPDQAATYCSAFEDAAGLRRERERSMCGGGSAEAHRYVLGRQREQFEFSATWHQRRGRPELAERYRLRAETCGRVLAEIDATASERREHR